MKDIKRVSVLSVFSCSKKILLKWQDFKALHCNPSESRMVARIFFRAESAESAEKKQERRSAMQSFSAPSAPLRAPVPSGRDLVRACTQCQTVRLLLEQDAWDRRKQREQSITGDCPSPRFLCCLLFESSVWLRLAALCSLVANSSLVAASAPSNPWFHLFGCGWPRYGYC